MESTAGSGSRAMARCEHRRESACFPEAHEVAEYLRGRVRPLDGSRTAAQVREIVPAGSFDAHTARIARAATWRKRPRLVRRPRGKESFDCRYNAIERAGD